MVEKLLTVLTITLGSVIVYHTGIEIAYHTGWILPITYTAGVLVLGAGIRSVLKGK